MAAAGSAQLTYRDVSAAGWTRMRRYRHPQKEFGGRGASRRGIAHANCFPAAGRLMRAGRAGAGGGSGARAHLGPSLSAGARAGRSERDGDTSLSQYRLVNTNRPKSRDKIFDLHYVHAHQRTSVSTDAHMRTRLANCLLVAAHRCATFDNFSRTDMQRRRGRDAPGHVAARQPSVQYNTVQYTTVQYSSTNTPTYCTDIKHNIKCSKNITSKLLIEQILCLLTKSWTTINV